jgi:hypothetical protein
MGRDLFMAADAAARAGEEAPPVYHGKLPLSLSPSLPPPSLLFSRLGHVRGGVVEAQPRVRDVVRLALRHHLLICVERERGPPCAPPSPAHVWRVRLGRGMRGRGGGGGGGEGGRGIGVRGQGGGEGERAGMPSWSL